MISRIKWMANRQLVTGYQRRKWVVSPTFQYTFMAHVIAIVLISFAIIYGANFYFFNTYLEKGMSLQLPPSHVFFDLLYEQQEFMNHVLLIAALTLSAVITIWGIIFSRRIAGPCYKIQSFFESKNAPKTTCSKEESRIALRSNDFFSEMADAINLFLAEQSCGCDDGCNCNSESKPDNH
jgi:hypothetical protein